MFTFKGFKIVNLISKTLSHIQPKSAENNEEEELVLEKGNPWQHSLQRLADEHKFNFDHISKSEELSNFVVDLSKAPNAPDTQKKIDPIAPKRVRARAGDRTINDMKSWWKDSLTPANESGHFVNELPGKPRLLKRWFE